MGFILEVVLCSMTKKRRGERNIVVPYPQFALCVGCAQRVVGPGSVRVRVTEPIPCLVAIFSDLFCIIKEK